MALKEMRHLELPLKSEELAHVYITDNSSSKALWAKMIKEMGGQQYYLDAKIWEKLMDKYSFEAIPSYLIFNKKGELKSKFTGYRGNRQMAEFIKDALKL
jgi:thioredoxin-related protein